MKSGPGLYHLQFILRLAPLMARSHKSHHSTRTRGAESVRPAVEGFGRATRGLDRPAVLGTRREERKERCHVRNETLFEHSLATEKAGRRRKGETLTKGDITGTVNP